MLVKEIKEVKRGRIKEYLRLCSYMQNILKDAEEYGLLNVM